MIICCEKEIIARFLCNSIILRPASSLSRARQIMSLYQGNLSGVNDWSVTLWLMLLSYGYGVWKNPSQTSPVLAIHVSVWYIQALTVLSGLQRDYLYFKSGWNYKTNKQTKKEEKNAQRSLLTWNAPNAFYAQLKLSLAKQCSESGRRKRLTTFPI